MGDMKTPDFDDLLAAFDIPDATSLDPKEAIQSTSDDTENHLKPSGMCMDENLSLVQSVPAPDVPAVSVIVKNTSRQESFEATDKEGNHMGPTLLQNGFRSPDVGTEPHSMAGYSKFEPTFINGDSSRGYTDKLEPHKTEPLPTFSQFSPISSPEPDDSSKDNGVHSKQKAAESPYFPQHSLYVPTEGCVVDSLRKPSETELSMFDEYCKKEQKSDCKEIEERTMEPSRDVENTNSLLGVSLALKEVQDSSLTIDKEFSEATVCSSAVPPRQRIKPAHSKLSSCVAALVALQAKKVVVPLKEEPLSVTKEAGIPLKESIKGSPMMPKSPKSPRSPLEVVKKIIKPPDSPMSVCSDTSSKGSPSVCAGSPPAIPKVRIKTIKTSSGEIKRTVTRILPEIESDDPMKSPEDIMAENSSGEDVKPTVKQEVTPEPEIEKVRNSGKSSAPTNSQASNISSIPLANAKGDKKKGVPASILQNPGNGSSKPSNSSQNKKQPAVSTKSANSTTLLPKAVHLANLNLVPNSVSTSVATKSPTLRPTPGQMTPMNVPLVHQVKIAAPVIVEAFNKLLHSANPVPTYTPNLSPPPECNIHLPASGYSCLECGDSFALEKSLSQHHNRRSVHIEVMCTQCSKLVQFYNKCSLLGHAREHKSKGLIMQCSQLMMKPISAEQMLALPPLIVPAVNSQALPSTQRTIVPAPLGVWSGTSSYAPPAMPLYADPYGLIRHGFKCLDCSKQVEDYTCLAGHYQRVAEEKDGLTCQVCQMMLPNKCSYGAHQRIHTHKSPYCCPECGVLCRSAYFQTHVKENCLHYTRKVAFRCIHCGVVFMSLGMLKAHIQDKHCEVFHKCSFCPMAFKSTESTAAHITAQHPTCKHRNAQIIYKCSCETVFNKKRLLHQHFYQNTNTLLVSVFRCPECQLAYMQKQLLVQHLKGVHGLPKVPEEASSSQKKPDAASEKNEDTTNSGKPSAKGEGPAPSGRKDSDPSESQHKLKLAGWTCGECSEWILDRETYIFHMKKSHGKCMKRYPCRQCERSFNSSASLRRHIRNNHDTKKDYTCCYCTEKPTFAKPSMLANHIILMHGIKNPELTQVTTSATLPQASSTQSRKQEQTKRTAKVTLDKVEGMQGPKSKKVKSLYKCAKCGFTTDSDPEFLKHIPQHKTDSSTCQCVHCGLCYTSQISLNRHLFIVHKVKEEEEENQKTEENLDSKPSLEPKSKSLKPEPRGSWECVQCNLTFDLESAHATHLRTHEQRSSRDQNKDSK